MSRVTIERIAAGGDGVGRLPSGKTVFVPRTAPGDDVDVAVIEEKARWARARVDRLLAAGPDRAEPPCPHYVEDGCGGCQLQHLTPEAQRAAKARIVGDALRRIGKRDLPDPALVPAPRALRYRAKITVAVAPDGRRMGLHRFDRPGQLFALGDCRITREPLMRCWQQVKAAADLLPADVTHLVLREDRSGGLHVVVRGGTPPWDPEPLFRHLEDPDVSLWWEPADGAPRVVAGARSGYPALAFAQVNPELAIRVRQDAVEQLGTVSGLVVWDLFGGSGDAARLLAAAGARVVSVDADRSAVAWARGQAPPTGAPEGSPRYLEGRVEEVLHRLPRPDAVLLNPPRGGLAAPVTKALDAWAREGAAGRRAVYVSCDPATLARDLQRMPSLRLGRVQAWDLFPQTAHVETTAVLEAA